MCGDGPILAGALAEAAETGGLLPDAVRRWLAQAGWHTTATLLCPDHT